MWNAALTSVSGYQHLTQIHKLLKSNISRRQEAKTSRSGRCLPHVRKFSGDRTHQCSM